MKPYYDEGGITIYHGDALELLPQLADNMVDLVLTDPPYFKVKADAWDRQWKQADEFLAWLDRGLAEFERLLVPNGSLYLFASPQMAARVEVLIRRRFYVLNRVRWLKDAGWHKKAKQTALRSFLSPWEEVIFAEHYGADNIAKGEAGYVAKCDELRGFVFEPLRAYIAREWERAGLTAQDANEATGTQMAGHYLTRSQWALPTRENYKKLQAYANGRGGDYLRREYEDLRREYEDLRRPFTVTADDQFTDVWNFPTVKPYAGKHPCEKPLAMLDHIISVSSRPEATVLDPFMGSGTTLRAAKDRGRKVIGIELDERYCEQAAERFSQPTLELAA